MYEETSYTKQSYSTHPLPLAISNPPHIHPPPIPLDPYSNPGANPPLYSGSDEQPAYYHDPGADSSRWVVKQAAPIKYSSPIVQPVIQQPVPLSNYGTSFPNPWLGQISITNTHKRKLKQPKGNPLKRSASQSVKCDLCKIECTSIQLYEKHISGKKHAKSLQKLYAPMINPQASQPINNSCSSGVSKLTNLETKKQKLVEGGTAVQSLRICVICNVACNGEIAFADHMAGKKHFSQERILANPPKPIETTTPKPRNTEPMWCEVCKISCTSSDGLNSHKEGKKHQKNLDKLQNPKIKNLNVASSKSKEVEDMEMKIQNVLQSGTAEDALKTCTICTVVCNSERVFNSHMSGAKHANMVKQAKTS